MHSSFVEPRNTEHDGWDDGGGSDIESCASSTMISTAGSQCSQKPSDGDEATSGRVARFKHKLCSLEQADQSDDHSVPYSIARYASTPHRHSRIKLASQHLESGNHSMKDHEQEDSHAERGGEDHAHGDVVAGGATAHNDETGNDDDDATTSEEEEDDDMPS